MKKSVKTSIVLAVMMGSAFYMPALNSVYAAETVEIKGAARWIFPKC